MAPVELHDIDKRSLATICRVSRRFGDIATPITYRTLRLNEQIIGAKAEVHCPRALGRVYAYTRHVEVRSDLNPHDVRRILDKIERLSSFKWCYVAGDATGATCWGPAEVLNPRHRQQTELHVEGLPLPSHRYRPHLEALYAAGIPAANLVSLRLAGPDPPLTTYLAPLKRLLLRAHRLRVLDYRDRGQGTRFFAPEGEGGGVRLRLPAVEALTLRSYDWGECDAAHWDFSRLRSLRLVDVPLLPFLATVPPTALRGLRNLRCDDAPSSSTPATSPLPLSPHFMSHHRQPYYYRRDPAAEKITGLLADLVREVRALHSLELTCHVRLFPAVHSNSGRWRGSDVVSNDGDCQPGRRRENKNHSGKVEDEEEPHDGVLLHHAPTLRRLRLRDYTGFTDEGRLCPTLPAADVAALATRLTELRALELDFDTAACDDPGAFLQALAAFPRLDTLTLHVQTTVRPFSSSSYSLFSSMLAGGDDDDDGEEEEVEDNEKMNPECNFFEKEEIQEGTQQGGDADWDAASRIFTTLVQGKKEQQEQRQRQHHNQKSVAVVPWWRITLIVGGWQPVMVRRPAEAWRELNARGVFAERCFVLERADTAAAAAGGTCSIHSSQQKEYGGGAEAMLMREEIARTAER